MRRRKLIAAWRLDDGCACSAGAAEGDAGGRLPRHRLARPVCLEIYARDGASLETSTLSGSVGATAAALTPLVDALAEEIIGSDTQHVDDTPAPVLAPGNGKTKTGRLWV